MTDTQTPDAEIDEKLAFAILQVVNALYAIARNARPERRARLLNITLLLSEVVEVGANETSNVVN